MKFKSVAFFICLTIIFASCNGEENSKGNTLTSSYSYSIEYNDADHGNYGHKIEVKDGKANVNVRAENLKKFSSNPFANEKAFSHVQNPPVVYSKPKEEVTYVPASEAPNYVPIPNKTQAQATSASNLQEHNPKSVPSPVKYSREQLAVLLSHNKNPFLPLKSNDSLFKYISQISAHPSYSNAPSNEYVSPEQTQPQIQHQNNQIQQVYYQPTEYMSQGYVQSNPTEYSHPQAAVLMQVVQPQYIYVPQNQNIVQSASPLKSSPVPQQQTYSVPHSSSFQPAQARQQQVTVPVQYVYNNYPKTNSQVAQESPSSYSLGRQQHLTIPSATHYQSNQIVYNVPQATNSVQSSYPTTFINKLNSPHTSSASDVYGTNTIHKQIVPTYVYDKAPSATIHNPTKISDTTLNNNYPQFAASGIHGTTQNVVYKTIVQHKPPSSEKYQLPSNTDNSGSLGSSNINYVNNYDPYKSGLSNGQINFYTPIEYNFNVNKNIPVQVTNSKTSNDAGQNVAQHNYNLGAQLPQNIHTPSATQNSNVQYIYVPANSPVALTGTGHQK